MQCNATMSMVLFFYQLWPGELCRLIVLLYIVCILHVCVYFAYCVLYFCRPISILRIYVLLHIHMFVRSLAVFLYYF